MKEDGVQNEGESGEVCRMEGGEGVQNVTDEAAPFVTVARPTKQPPWHRLQSTRKKNGRPMHAHVSSRCPKMILPGSFSFHVLSTQCIHHIFYTTVGSKNHVCSSSARIERDREREREKERERNRVKDREILALVPPLQ
jgi:hypothetical protein